MTDSIPVIDLFAGPGGLSEGFTSFSDGEGGKRPFKIAISIENEPSAHQTLKLRALYRQFSSNSVPSSYFEFMKGNLGASPDEELYRLPELRDAVSNAEREARRLTLGKNHAAVYNAIREGVGRNECILIGGPPCQAYSLVGRSRNYGDKDKKYVATEDPKNYLYKEYLRIVSRFQPVMFVMENVKGMLSANVGGQSIFEKIRADLQDPCKAVSTLPEKGRKKHKYKLFSFVTELGSDLFGRDELAPSDFVIRCEQFGVPQSRHRVILLGVRDDVVGNTPPGILVSSDHPVSVGSVIEDLPRIRSRLSKESDSASSWVAAVKAFPKHSVSGTANSELKGRVSSAIDQLRAPRADCGAEFGLTRGSSKKIDHVLASWYFDPRLSESVANHVARGHTREDLHRYLFCAAYAKLHGESPTSRHFPRSLWPRHENFGSGHFADRFRVQCSSKPGSTVTSHISKDGHYYIHPDPTQCRSLTVREAARIQTFPDSYFFAGNRTQQYVQVGNAVPPFLARQLAQVVYSHLSR